jgi:bifunctional non-homologous end joining protein LigD
MRADGPRPMLASPMVAPLKGAEFDKRFGGGGWALEEKLDGHRCIAQVRAGEVTAWSRPMGSRAPLRRPLPPAILEQLATFPDGDYDGELVPTSGKAWDVKRKSERLVFVVFDVAWSIFEAARGTYDERREMLLEILALMPREQTAVSTVLSGLPSWAAVEAIWQRGGEGAILKRRASYYEPGRRSPEWLKVKQVHAATLRLVGYDAGKSGPYSALRLVGDDGSKTSVKTLTQHLLRAITAAPASFLGREVVISYQERTPSGMYRHAIFDHFVD